MQFRPLVCHSSSRAPEIAVEAIATFVATDAVSFRYRVRGDVNSIRVPPVRPALRKDDLWRHTCFEAFVKRGNEDGYVELNFAPSTEWAAYSFEGYRAGMAPLSQIETPAIEHRLENGAFTLAATLNAHSFGSASALGLSAVIEHTDGRLSYWALAHPRSTPDFHDSAGWTQSLQIAGRTPP